MKNKVKILKDILNLPKKTIRFCGADESNISNHRKVYKYFTKLHRTKLFRNKTVGIALIDLDIYEQGIDGYLKKVNGKNSAAYYARKAVRQDYQFMEIDKNDYVNDIHEINTSSLFRQGQKMSDAYLEKTEKFERLSNQQNFGVLKENTLYAYCDICFYGEFVIINKLLGHKKFLNDGIMYFMLIKVHELIFRAYKQEKVCRYIMYDTYFGASDGLKMFKRKLDYLPYKVKWRWEN